MASSDRTRKSPGAAASGRRGLRDRVRHRVEAAREKYAGSTAEHLWHRLDAMDFINRGMLFAAKPHLTDEDEQQLHAAAHHGHAAHALSE